MSSYALPIVIALVAFTMGFFTSEFRQTDSTDSEQTTNSNTQNKTSSFLNEASNQLGLNLQDNVLTQGALSVQDQEKVFALLKNMPEKRIGNYLSQAFPDQEIDDIQDKKQFAERLLQELNEDKDESKTLTGRIHFSTTAQTPLQDMPLNQIHKQQFIYAHFDTFGKAPPNTQVFVKWLNVDTQEIVLFSPKYIQENSNQNWVSAVPARGWEPGKYSVKFYQMEDTLSPIAQSSFILNSVSE